MNLIPASAIGAAIALIPIAPTANAAMIANALNIFGISKIAALQVIFKVVTLASNDLQWFTMIRQ